MVQEVLLLLITSITFLHIFIEENLKFPFLFETCFPSFALNLEIKAAASDCLEVVIPILYG